MTVGDQSARLLDAHLIDFLLAGNGRHTERCILMFSGGRDSALAAVRLHERGEAPVLVTISSSHLKGMNRVRRRLNELTNILPSGTLWIHVRQPERLLTDTSFYWRTCLPCHHAYVVASAAVAASAGARKIAFGYAGYQNSWPEQTPLAVDRLSVVLREFGIELILPVYDLASRAQAAAELDLRGLSTESLEQKCSRQILNMSLSADALSRQIVLWEKAIRSSMESLPMIKIEVLDSLLLRPASL